MLSSKEIRQQFLDFFISKEHKYVHSSPVVPNDDPTLLFTNAGMNQFKNVFLGQKNSDIRRAVNSQKCIRAGGKHNDLEEVGKDGYHHTFFEMLGNWSFADYYKKEAISWAWELFTEVWKLPKEKLYASIHDTDDDAGNLWKECTDINHSHVMKFGDKENFWEMGDSGPCGPCSEIHYDRGPEFCEKQGEEGHVCLPNGDCSRIIELWNLVFIQYNRGEDGNLTPLKDKFVDTGAGLERVCQILQGQNSNYHTDLFTPILEAISELSKVPYNQETGVSHRVIADHIRALTFSIADGGMPSNEGRGYVLRRILRRASRHGRLLNMHDAFLYKLVDTVVEIMGHQYPELKENKAHIKMIIKAEEERFNLTLDNGLQKFEEICTSIENKTIGGASAFQLYDTFGFPLDLTVILAEEKGLTVDEKGFHAEMEKQRCRAREASNFKLKLDATDWIEFGKSEKTEFTGYDRSQLRVRIVKYSIDDKNQVRIVLDKTPFYAESGGQVGDLGNIYNGTTDIKIHDVKKDNDLFIHLGELVMGEITDSEYMAIVDEDNRKNIARNHTATHLLHKALKEVLGNHVQQKGSLVCAEHLRFDFTHYQAMTERELEMVEKIVNQKIRECLPVSIKVSSLKEAKEEGATALFGEKYGDSVRIVTVGDFSKELCGGTHVKFTGEIGLCKIIMETSTAAGIRRIEALTGEKAEEYVLDLQEKMQELEKILNVPEKQIFDRLHKILQENKDLGREIETLKAKSANNMVQELIDNAKEINGVKLITAQVKVNDTNELRALNDTIKTKFNSGIAVFLADIEGKVSILVSVSADLVSKYHAGKIAGKLAEIVGGKGGGRPDMAMAGGKDVEKIGEALTKIEETLFGE